MKRALLMGVLAGVLGSNLWVGKARADIPPPPDYVEQCTVEKQTAPGKTCVACNANFGNRTGCQTQYGGEGYAKACQSYGASVWTEVWCRGGTTPVPPPTEVDAGSPSTGGGNSVPPVPPGPVGCSCQTAGAVPGTLVGAWLVVGAALVALRRRRRD